MYFDEMNHLDYELRAFEELTKSEFDQILDPFALKGLSLMSALNAPATSASNPP